MRKTGLLARVRVDASPEYLMGWKTGVKAAAAVTSDYDGMSSHRFLVSDCVLMKLNVVKGERARPNRRADYEFLRGFALALASMNRAVRLDLDVAAVMREAGVTTAMLNKSGVEEYDLESLPRVLARRKSGKKTR